MLNHGEMELKAAANLLRMSILLYEEQKQVGSHGFENR